MKSELNTLIALYCITRKLNWVRRNFIIKIRNVLDIVDKIQTGFYDRALLHKKEHSHK